MTYPPNFRALALDMASIVGWSQLSAGLLTSGSQDFRRGKLTHPGAPHGLFDNWLREKLREASPEIVIYEQAGFFKSADAVQICVGFRGVLLAQTAKLGIPVVGYSPTSVKLFWCGSGRGDKGDMMAATRRRLPAVKFCDHNEVDSLGLMHFHLSKIGHESLELIAS